MTLSTSIGPRARVLYLVAVAVGVFVFSDWAAVAGIAAGQAALWLIVGLPLRRLGRQLVKLWLFTVFVVASYALFGGDTAGGSFIEVPHLGIALSPEGALEGATMVLRVVAVVLASQVARAGDPRAVALGLERLFVPARVAVSLDVVLALLGAREGGGGGGGGRGDGSGGGRRRGRSADGEGFWVALKRLGRGDVSPLVDRLERHIRRAESHAEASDAPPEIRRDVAIIAGVALTMLAIKMLKVLPALPFAPGHKLVLLTPLYLAAALLTRTRFGATLTGVVMGTVAFLMGDGRYGVFEILKHVAPGLVCDLLLPLLVPASGPRKDRVPPAWAFALLGLAMGLGRFATIFTVTLFVQPPAVAYAFLAPGVALNAFFGLLSGWVSYHVVVAVIELRARLTPPTVSIDPDPEPSLFPGGVGEGKRKQGSRKRAEVIG